MPFQHSNLMPSNIQQTCASFFSLLNLYTVDLQVHQLQQDNDSAVLHAGTLRKRLGWLLCHVYHHLPGLHPAWLLVVWDPGWRFQQFWKLLVSSLTFLFCLLTRCLFCNPIKIVPMTMNFLWENDLMPVFSIYDSLKLYEVLTTE